MTDTRWSSGASGKSTQDPFAGQCCERVLHSSRKRTKTAIIRDFLRDCRAHVRVFNVRGEELFESTTGMATLWPTAGTAGTALFLPTRRYRKFPSFPGTAWLWSRHDTVLASPGWMLFVADRLSIVLCWSVREALHD